MLSLRNRELVLLMAATVLTCALYALASLGRNASIPADIAPFLGVVFALLLAAHVAVRKFAPNADATILPVVGLLNGLGYVFIVRLSADVDGASSLPGQQATWTGVGVIGFIATLVVIRNVRTLDRYRYIAVITGLMLLILPLVPGLGREVNGARIWVSAGPISFQPGEFAKIALAVFLASYLAEKGEMIGSQVRKIGPLEFPELRHLVPVVLAWGLSLIVMVAEKDLGSSLLLLLVIMVVMWVATSRPVYLVTGIVLFVAGGWVASKMFGHVQSRIDIWLDPWASPKGAGFQPVEATFALANGGLTGTGPGRGEPQRIPEVETDFVFAAIGEELGLAGSTIILIAFLVLVTAGLRIALNVESSFGKLLATSLAALLGLQAFIIIGGVIRVIPLTGITLPFVSYGGSSLVANYVIAALLIRVSTEPSRIEAS